MLAEPLEDPRRATRQQKQHCTIGNLVLRENSNTAALKCENSNRTCQSKYSVSIMITSRLKFHRAIIDICCKDYTKHPLPRGKCCTYYLNNTCYIYSSFQTFAVFCMLYLFFWVIPRRLNFIRRRFGTLCLFHIHRQVGTYLPMKMEQTVFRNVGI